MITVNGAPNALVTPGTTVAGMLDLLGIEAGARGYAIALDADVVPRAEWATRTVPEGASVEILTAVQGG